MLVKDNWVAAKNTFSKVESCRDRVKVELDTILEAKHDGKFVQTMENLLGYEKEMKSRVFSHLAFATSQARDAMPTSSQDLSMFQSALFGAVVQVQQVWMLFSEFYEEFGCQELEQEKQEG